MNNVIYHFDKFFLDTNTRKLFNQEKYIPLSTRAYDILHYLIKKQGEVVTKDDLLQNVWSDSFVEESNLAVHISALRRTLGEKRGEKKFIETISGRGYCFVTTANSVNSLEAEKTKEIIINQNETHKIDEINSSLSIAVLPIVVINSKTKIDEDYLAEGLAENIIDSLSQLPNLKVIAYSAIKQYKNSSLDLQEIGFQLGVSKLLIGNIYGLESRLSLKLEMVNAIDKSHIWGAEYFSTSDEIFNLKNEISVSIADKLQVKINETDLNTKKELPILDIETHKLYLKARYILDSKFVLEKSKETLNQAIEIFQNVINQVPHFAPAYAGIAFSYFSLCNYHFLPRAETIPKANTYLQLALTLDPNLSDAHLTKGILSLSIERNWEEAENSLKLALKLNPNNLSIYNWLSLLSIHLGRFETAQSYQTKALELNPLSIHHIMGLCRVFFFMGEFEKAVIQAREALDMDSRLFAPTLFYALSKSHLGDFEEAIISINRTIEIHKSQETLSVQSYIYAMAGKKNEAKIMLEEVIKASNKEITDFYDIAITLSALGEDDRAFEYLEKAFLSDSVHISMLKIDPRIKNLRGDQRYFDLIKKLRLDH